MKDLKKIFWGTPIFIKKIKHSKILNHMLIEHSYNLKKNSFSVKKSNEGGWQSDLQDTNKIPINILLKQIQESCKKINKNIKDVLVNQLWININSKNDWNSVHQHSQYHISGTYYVKTNKNCGEICFRDPRPGALTNNVYKIYEQYPIQFFNPEDGMLILFPSFLDHYVKPNKSEEDRISISFDIFLK
jgi:uncharacterized protein (TIGR02466 family)